MKQCVWTLMLAFLLTAGFVSCGQSGEKAEAGGEEAASVPGIVKESADFKILVPEGWEFQDFGNGTVQTYNKSGTFLVQLQKAGMNMTEKDVESSLESLRKQYNGTPMKKMDMLGLSFYTTTFVAAGRSQTFYNALKDGKKISIGLSGPDHEKDPTIQAVFKSVALK